MSDRVRVQYSCSGPDKYQQVQESVRELIQNDTGQSGWIETRSFPPIGVPPPLSSECVEKLKALDGVQVREMKDD